MFMPLLVACRCLFRSMRHCFLGRWTWQKINLSCFSQFLLLPHIFSKLVIECYLTLNLKKEVVEANLPAKWLLIFISGVCPPAINSNLQFPMAFVVQSTRAVEYPGCTFAEVNPLQGVSCLWHQTIWWWG